jgi:hypothetical protein
MKFTAYLCVYPQCRTEKTHIAPTVDQDSLHHPEKPSQRVRDHCIAPEDLLHAAKLRINLVKKKASWRSDVKITKTKLLFPDTA